MRSFLVVITYLFLVNIVFAAGDGTVIHLNVQNCNNNNICESQYGENANACPLDCTATSTPPATSTSNGGGRSSLIQHPFDSDIVPNSLRVSFDTDGSAIISWKTYGLAKDTLYWGRSADTEIGSIGEIDFKIDHYFLIYNLKPSTLYFYRIESVDRWSHHSYLNNQYFITPNVTVSETPELKEKGTTTLPVISGIIGAREQNPPGLRLVTVVGYSLWWLLLLLILILLYILWPRKEREYQFAGKQAIIYSLILLIMFLSLIEIIYWNQFGYLAANFLDSLARILIPKP